MKRKEVDDVLGGKDAWKNVDKSEGRLSRLIEGRRRIFAFIFLRERTDMTIILGRWRVFMTLKLTRIFQYEAQCTREGCDGIQAYFKQIQIRSADEPMTIFYRV